MLRLLILRHAKAARPAGIRDLDRPLTPRGRSDAIHMGEYLKAEGLIPDLALVSPSARTQETWSGVRQALGQVPSRSEPDIYEAPPNRLLALVREAGSTACVLLVCHNPGGAELARMLVRPGSGGSDIRAMSEAFPTAALAEILFETQQWTGIAIGHGRLERFVTPAQVAGRNGENED